MLGADAAKARRSANAMRTIFFATALFAVLLAVGAPCLSKPKFASAAIEAASIAYADFKSKLKSRTGDGELAAYLAEPDNYNIGISQTESVYIIVFVPRRSGSFKYLMGGGAEYQIRKSDMSIEGFVKGK